MRRRKEVNDTDFRIIKRIVKKELKQDIEEDSRRRAVVQGRIIYSKILRDVGYTFEDIGESISKNHDNIMYYMRVFDTEYDTNTVLRNKYDKCLLEYNRFIYSKSKSKKYSNVKDPNEEIIKDIKKFEDKIKLLILDLNEIKRVSHLSTRFHDIIEYLDMVVPERTENIALRRIKKIFDKYI